MGNHYDATGVARPLEEAIRFSEEYGYNRWAEARDEAATLRDRVERLEEIKRAASRAVAQVSAPVGEYENYTVPADRWHELVDALSKERERE